MTNPTSTPDVSSDLVVLVHGFGGKRLAMEPLRRRLIRAGFRVALWTYPSGTLSIGHHGRNLHAWISESFRHERKIHLIAHSMGAIVTRHALSLSPISNLGRAVLLAPPNRGTPAARYAAILVGRFCTPIADLADTDESTVNRIPPPHGIEIGVLAARFDLLVPVANTHLKGEREHSVMNATHNSMLLSKKTARLATAFITEGRFESPPI